MNDAVRNGICVTCSMFIIYICILDVGKRAIRKIFKFYRDANELETEYFRYFNLVGNAPLLIRQTFLDKLR